MTSTIDRPTIEIADDGTRRAFLAGPWEPGSPCSAAATTMTTGPTHPEGATQRR